MRTAFLMLALGIMALVGCADDPARKSEIVDFTASFAALDTTGVVNDPISVSFDPLGRLHVAYGWQEREWEYQQPWERAEIRLARLDGPRRHIETISAADEDARSPELFFDAEGQPVVLYSNMTNGYNARLCLARRRDGAWVTTVIDSNGFVGTWSSGLTAPDGRLHVAYFAGYPYYDLRYARQEGEQWITEVVDADREVGYDARMVMDPAGDLLIAYHGADPWTLKLAEGSAGAWRIEALDHEVTNIGSLRLDAAGLPVIAGKSGLPTLFRRGENGWGAEAIPATGPEVWDISLDFDSDGTPWVTFMDAAGSRIGWREGGWRTHDLSSLCPPETIRLRSVMGPRGRMVVAVLDLNWDLHFGVIEPVTSKTRAPAP